MTGIRARAWLLTETVRLHEERHGRVRDDETANVLARDGARDLESRLVRRAAALPVASSVRSDLTGVQRLLVRLSLVLMALAVLAGIFAGLTSAQQRQVDVLLAAASMLFLPGLMLIVWLGTMLLTRPGRASPGLSRGLLAFGLRRLGPRLMSGPLAAETVAAGAGLLLTAPGRWLMGTLTHLFWAVYGLSAMLTLALLFSIAQYDLSWGTTILADETAVGLIEGMAWFPAVLGLIEIPTADWILTGREGLQSGALRAEWARFLLVLVAVYGILPRLLFGLVTAAFAVHGLGHMRLDTARPGYLRLAGALHLDTDIKTRGTRPSRGAAPLRQRPSDAVGPPLWVGVELEAPDWPVQADGMNWRALGRADTRAQRTGLLAAVAGLDAPPPAVLAQCSALRTPDEGTGRFLSALADAAGTVLVIWLDDLADLIQRGGDPTEREADWRSLAERIGATLVAFDTTQPDQSALHELRQATGTEA